MIKILAFTTALVLLIGAGTALADERHGRDRHRDNDHGFDRGGFDRGGFNRDGFDRDRHNSGRDWRRHDRDNVSVNFSFGNVWRPAYRDYRYNSFDTFGIGIGYNSFGMNTFNSWGTPHSNFGYINRSYNNRRPVVVYQNTYIDTPAPATRVITRSKARSGTSLLRDIHGRCYERETDRYGNETRTELPAEDCNF